MDTGPVIGVLAAIAARWSDRKDEGEKMDITKLREALGLPDKSAGGVSRGTWGQLAQMYGEAAFAACILTAQAETLGAVREDNLLTRSNLAFEHIAGEGKLITPGHVTATTNVSYLASFNGGLGVEAFEYAIGDAQNETLEALWGAGLIDEVAADELIETAAARRRADERRFNGERQS
jgi:hypothetical protein